MLCQSQLPKLKLLPLPLQLTATIPLRGGTNAGIITSLHHTQRNSLTRTHWSPCYSSCKKFLQPHWWLCIPTDGLQLRLTLASLVCATDNRTETCHAYWTDNHTVVTYTFRLYFRLLLDYVHYLILLCNIHFSCICILLLYLSFVCYTFSHVVMPYSLHLLHLRILRFGPKQLKPLDPNLILLMGWCSVSYVELLILNLVLNPPSFLCTENSHPLTSGSALADSTFPSCEWSSPAGDADGSLHLEICLTC
jgi:hypothetical protein